MEKENTLPIHVRKKILSKGYKVDLSKAYKKIKKIYNADKDYSNLKSTINAPIENLNESDIKNLVSKTINDKEFPSKHDRPMMGTMTVALASSLGAFGVTNYAINSVNKMSGPILGLPEVLEKLILMPETSNYAYALPIAATAAILATGLGTMYIPENKKIPPESLVKENLSKTLDDALIVND